MIHWVPIIPRTPIEYLNYTTLYDRLTAIVSLRSFLDRRGYIPYNAVRILIFRRYPFRLNRQPGNRCKYRLVSLPYTMLFSSFKRNPVMWRVGRLVRMRVRRFHCIDTDRSKIMAIGSPHFPLL